jgi:hypothetical protein
MPHRWLPLRPRADLYLPAPCHEQHEGDIFKPLWRQNTARYLACGQQLTPQDKVRDLAASRPQRRGESLFLPAHQDDDPVNHRRSRQRPRQSGQHHTLQLGRNPMSPPDAVCYEPWLGGGSSITDPATDSTLPD